VSKFVDHLPFYRQVLIFKRQQLTIPESTIGGWFNASCRLLEPLYDTLKTRLITSDYLMADETPIPVQTQDKPGSTHKGYHWVYYYPESKLVLFDYQKTRGREGTDELLRNFTGHLQTDGYTAYNNLKNRTNIIQMACMAHAGESLSMQKTMILCLQQKHWLCSAGCMKLSVMPVNRV